MAAKYMLVAGSPVPEDVCRDVRRCIWAQLRPEQRDLLASLRGDDDDTWTPQQGVSYEATARRRIGKTTLQLANLLLLVFDNQGTSGKASFFCSGRRQWRNCQDILRKFLDTIKECTQLDPSKAAAELLDGGATLHLGSWEV